VYVVHCHFINCKYHIQYERDRCSTLGNTSVRATENKASNGSPNALGLGLTDEVLIAAITYDNYMYVPCFCAFRGTHTIKAVMDV
jgi:hypothetical protein